MPSSAPATGQGGQFAKPTLASFSLEGKVGVVTGGARGLGLVMAQGMFVSGADIALVDLNGSFLGLVLLCPVALLSWATASPQGASTVVLSSCCATSC